MQWNIKDLPFSVQNKPTELLQKGLTAANLALSKGLSEDEATFACLQKIKSLEKHLKPSVGVSRNVPEHVKQLLKQKLQEPEVQQSINKAFLGENSLESNKQRTVVNAEFNQNNQLVILFDTGEKITTKPIDITQNIEQYLSVSAGFSPILNNPQEGQVLSYNSTTGFWENRTVSSSGTEEDVYAKRVDFVGDTVIYKAEATAGTLDSASAWRIHRLIVSVDGDVSETWAEGNTNFNKIWNDRLTYTYS
jgi:hypothetical protein